MGIKTPINKISEDAFTRTQSLITVKEVKERYLFGIDLKDDQGNELPARVIQHYIDTSVSFLEHKLDIIIFPTKLEELHDYRAQDYSLFNFIQLKKRPVSEVVELKAQLPNNNELVNYPKEWFVLEKEAGHIQLSPTAGTFSSLVVTQGGSYIPLIYGSKDYWPHLFKVTYNAGFDADCIPTIINEMIGLQAAIRLFDIFGDLLLSPGVVNENVSMDGASTGKSKNVAGFKARIDSYRESLKDYIDTVKKYYSGFTFVVA